MDALPVVKGCIKFKIFSCTKLGSRLNTTTSARFHLVYGLQNRCKYAQTDFIAIALINVAIPPRVVHIAHVSDASSYRCTEIEL
jgi:hypothetical protein